MAHFWYHLRNRFIKAYDSGYLPEQDGHKIFFQQIGNPKGQPVICFHGGPGSGGRVSYAYSYNLKKYRVIIFDQRGCGLSEYKNAFKNNTIQKTVEDAKRILDHLQIKTKVISAGCSWGSTCALMFAQTYPERIKKILVNAVFLARKKDAHNIAPTADLFYPDLLDELNTITSQKELDFYFGKLIFSEKRSDREKAMKYYSTLEDVTNFGALSYSFKTKNYTDKEILKFQIYMHYQLNNFFLQENQILKNATKIKDIPTLIYQNRWDPCCPPYQAYELHKALPKSKLNMIASRGHISEKMFWKMYQDNLNDYK